MTTNRVLVFEPFPGGHHREYLEHLVRFTPGNGSGTIVFTVHPRLEAELRAIASARSNDSIVFDPIPAALVDGGKGTPLDTFRLWRFLISRTNVHRPARVLLMAVNPFQHLLGGAAARNAELTWSGILFSPYIRLETRGMSASQKVAYGLKRVRKDLQMRWMLSNGRVGPLFLLNDSAGAGALNQRFGAGRFQPLPDPVMSLEEESADRAWLRSHYNIDRGRRTLLLCGSLRRSKGVLRSLRAVEELSEPHRSACALLLLGKVKPEFRDAVLEEIERVRRAAPNLKIILHDEFLARSEFRRAVAGADLLLLPYERPEGSSGILGHAAAAGVPVLGPDRGLLGELIREHRLGATLAVDEPGALARALEEFFRLPGSMTSYPEGAARFVRERSPAEFARILLDQGVR